VIVVGFATRVLHSRFRETGRAQDLRLGDALPFIAFHPTSHTHVTRRQTSDQVAGKPRNHHPLLGVPARQALPGEGQGRRDQHLLFAPPFAGQPMVRAFADTLQIMSQVTASIWVNSRSGMI
jgi:hypothetical protein